MATLNKVLCLRLDEQGRQQLASLLVCLGEQVAEIEAESADRLSRAPGDPVYESSLAVVPFFDRMPAP